MSNTDDSHVEESSRHTHTHTKIQSDSIYIKFRNQQKVNYISKVHDRWLTL